MTKAITEIYLTRLLSVKVQRQTHFLNQTFVKYLSNSLTQANSNFLLFWEWYSVKKTLKLMAARFGIGQKIAKILSEKPEYLHSHCVQIAMS